MLTDILLALDGLGVIEIMTWLIKIIMRVTLIVLGG